MSSRIAILSVSTRPKPYNKFICQYVESRKPKSLTELQLEQVDLAQFKLPSFNEPIYPMRMPPDNPSPHYFNEYAKNWSATAMKYDAFIIVTPQYNWSIPASLKNALDYLYHELVGKPVGLITYGSRGGEKAAAHLADIVGGAFKMDLCDSKVRLKITHTSYEETQKLQRMSPEREAEWASDGSEKAIQDMYFELASKLKTKAT